jgi:hypothetical protein
MAPPRSLSAIFAHIEGRSDAFFELFSVIFEDFHAMARLWHCLFDVMGQHPCQSNSVEMTWIIRRPNMASTVHHTVVKSSHAISKPVDASMGGAPVFLD